MKNKIYLILLMTAAVFGGGFVLIEQLSQADNKLLGFGDNEPSIVIIPNGISKIGTENKFPASKVSGKFSSSQPDEIITTLTDNQSLISGSQASGSGSSLLSSNTYAYRAESGQDNLSASGSTSMLMGLSGGGSQSKNMMLAEASSSSSFTMSTGLMAAPKATIGVTNVENSFPVIDSNQPADQFTPTEGAPVGDGLYILLILAVVYLFFQNKYRFLKI